MGNFQKPLKWGITSGVLKNSKIPLFGTSEKRIENHTIWGTFLNPPKWGTLDFVLKKPKNPPIWGRKILWPNILENQ